MAPSLIPAQAWRSDQDGPARRAQARRALSGGSADGGASADGRGRSGPRSVPSAGGRARGPGAEPASTEQAAVAPRLDVVRGKESWSQGHRLWLRSLRFEHAADQVVLDDYLLAIEQVEERLKALEEQIEQASQQERYARGGCAALLPRHRHVDRDDLGGGAARLHALRLGPRPDGVPGLWSRASTPRAARSNAVGSRRPAMATRGGC